MFCDLPSYPEVEIGKSATAPASCSECNSILMKRASMGSSKEIVVKVDASPFTSVHNPIVGPSDDNTRTFNGYLIEILDFRKTLWN